MYELRALGSPALNRTGGLGLPPVATRLAARPKHFAVLSYLALADGQRCRRDTLIALFWPEASSPRARNALSKTLSRIRAELGDAVIRTAGAHEVAIAPGALAVDVDAFRAAVETGTWDRALECYRGDFLTGFHLPDAPGFESWLDDLREGLRREAADAARRLADAQANGGNAAAALETLRRAVALAPLDEHLARRLMTRLHETGNRGAALAAFRALEDALRRELDASPSQETRALADVVRASSAIGVLAVLPWANLTGRSDQEYLADGLTDAVITELAATGSGRVISRQSVLQLKGADLPLPEIGARLGADAVVEGSVARFGEHLTVTAQLVGVELERHLWAQAFEVPLDELPALAARIAAAVAARVRDSAGAAIAAPAPPPSHRMQERGDRAADRPEPGAYLAYLEARHFSGMLHGLSKAVASYRMAIAAAPDFAAAWAGLASALAAQTLMAVRSPAELFPPFRQAAQRALALDPELGEAHTALGLYRMLADRDWAGAEEALRHGVMLAPAAAEPHVHYALYLAAMGAFDEARRQLACALEVDPLGPATRFADAWCLYKAGRAEQSNACLDRLLELHPHFALALVYRALNCALLGDAAAAEAAAALAFSALPDAPELLALAAAALGRAGRASQSREALGRLLSLERERYVDPWAVAVAYAGLGADDDALQWLRRMYDERSPSAFCIRHDPMLDPLRDDARFRDIVRRLAFPAGPSPAAAVR